MGAAKPVTYRISAPESSFTGVVGGIAFANGVYEGEVPDGPLTYFTGAGYTVEEIKAKRAAAQPADADAKAAQEAADAQAKADADATAAADAANNTGSK